MLVVPFKLISSFEHEFGTLDEEKGFSFRNCRRNELLLSQGFVPPKMTKTGTTICGIVYKDGVILGGDTRATNGKIVWAKCCKKIYKIQNNIFVAGAGSAADIEAMVKWMQANAENHRLNTNRKIIPIQYLVTITKRMFFQYGGAISSVFIIGGYDNNGPKLYVVSNHGSVRSLPYITMGSGSYIAMSILETRWRPNMEENEAKELVADAITAGILNDLGSGTNVDLCVIKKESSQKLYAVRKVCESGKKNLDYKMKPGTTGILSKTIKKIDYDVIEEDVKKLRLE